MYVVKVKEDRYVSWEICSLAGRCIVRQVYVRVHHRSMTKNSVTGFELSGFSLCVVIYKGKR